MKYEEARKQMRQVASGEYFSLTETFYGESEFTKQRVSYSVSLFVDNINCLVSSHVESWEMAIFDIKLQISNIEKAKLKTDIANLEILLKESREGEVA